VLGGDVGEDGGRVNVDAPGDAMQTNSVAPPPATKTVEVAATPVEAGDGVEAVSVGPGGGGRHHKRDVEGGDVGSAGCGEGEVSGLRKRVLGMEEMDGMEGMDEGAPEEGVIERAPASSPLPVGRTPVRLGTSPGL